MPFQRAKAQTLCSESGCLNFDQEKIRRDSTRPARDLKGSKVARDVIRIEGWSGEWAYRTVGDRRSGLAKGRIVKIGPKHRYGRLERLRAERGLSPACHLRVEPGRLHRIGARGSFPSDEEIAAALTDAAVGRDLEAPVQSSPNNFGVDADPFGLGQDARHFGAIGRMLDELGGA